MYIPGTTYLHILLHCTLYLIAHLTPYFISLFVSYFILTIFVYIYILSRVLFHSFYCFYVIFILLLCFLFFCTFHWADLSWLTFHYLLYPVWLCMWQIIKNLEPWTLNLPPVTGQITGSQDIRCCMSKTWMAHPCKHSPVCTPCVSYQHRKRERRLPAISFGPWKEMHP